jgi:hypothetical protein
VPDNNLGSALSGLTLRGRDIAGVWQSAGAGLLALSVLAGTFTPNAGQAAAAIATGAVRRVRLRADIANSQDNPIWIAPIGQGTGTGYPLWPGDVLPFALEVDNLNLIGASCALANQKLHYLAEV